MALVSLKSAIGVRVVGRSVLEAKLNELGDDDEAVGNYGVDYATAQCAELLKQGVPGIHFYTLNKPHSTARILRNLGLAPK